MQDYTFVKKLQRKDTYLYKSNKTGIFFEVFKVYRATFSQTHDFKFLKQVHERVDIEEVSWIIMKYMPKRTLSEILNNNIHIEEPYLRVIFNEICRIGSALHQHSYSGLGFELEDISIDEGGEIIIDNYFRLTQESSAKSFIEDLKRLIDFIYRISRLDRTKTKDLCVSRRFSDFLCDLNRYPLKDKSTDEQIENLRQHKFLTSQSRKIDLLLDLIDELSENSDREEFCKPKLHNDEVSNQVIDNVDLFVNSDSFDRPEISGSKAFSNSNQNLETLTRIVEDAFAKQLSACYEDKITYKALLNIKKSLIELGATDPNCLKETINSYLNYRQLLPKIN